MNYLQKIQAADRAVDAANWSLADAIAEAYPVGSTVTFEQGESLQHAEVLGHSLHGYSRNKQRLRVRNIKTGKERFLYATRIGQRIDG